MLLQPGDLGPGLLPTVEAEPAQQPAAEKRGDHLGEQHRAVNRDRAGVFVAPVQVHAAGEGEGPGAVARLGKDLQIGRAGGVGADVHQAVVA